MTFDNDSMISILLCILGTSINYVDRIWGLLTPFSQKGPCDIWLIPSPILVCQLILWMPPFAPYIMSPDQIQKSTISTFLSWKYLGLHFGSWETMLHFRIDIDIFSRITNALQWQKYQYHNIREKVKKPGYNM